MSPKENIELARRIYGLVNEGHLDQAVNLATEDVEVRFMPFDQTFHGHEGLLAFVETFKRAFPDLHVEVVNQVATEDQIVNECVWHGTHKGPLLTPNGEIPPTGRKVEGGRFVEVWTIKHGKLASLHNYQDVSSWLSQLGLLSAEAGR